MVSAIDAARALVPHYLSEQAGFRIDLEFPKTAWNQLVLCGFGEFVSIILEIQAE